MAPGPGAAKLARRGDDMVTVVRHRKVNIVVLKRKSNWPSIARLATSPSSTIRKAGG
jgi:hypothetical protein